MAEGESLSLGVVKKQAEQLFNEGKREQAETLLKGRFPCIREDLESWFLLGVIQLQQEKFTKAEQTFLDILSRYPDTVEVHANLGLIYKSKGNLICAKTHLQKALSVNPNFLPALLSLGIVLCQLSEFDKGIACFQAVLSRDSNALSAMKNIGDAYRGKGEYALSELWYRRSLAKAPDYLLASLALVRVFQIRKEKEKLRHILNPLLERYPENVDVAIALGHACHLLKDEDRALSTLKGILDQENIAYNKRIALCFRIAAILDKQNKFSEAFSFYKKANEPLVGNYDRVRMEKDVDRYRRFFNASDDKENEGEEGQEFIFIVGMPRSGTSLIEQILDSHPAVKGVGELMAISHIAADLMEIDGTHGLVAMDVEARRSMYHRYREEVLKNAGNTVVDTVAMFVDKMPFNYLYVGLIFSLFPKAKVIHCCRTPLDTCLSNYFQEFGGHLPFSHDLSDIGHYYGQYHEMMKHWERMYGKRILRLQYETLVDDFEMELQRVLNYCGLRWNERCLDFHKNRRIVATASVEQVARPLYTSSVGRWKNYMPYLEPLRKALNGADIDCLIA